MSWLIKRCIGTLKPVRPTWASTGLTIESLWLIAPHMDTGMLGTAQGQELWANNIYQELWKTKLEVNLKATQQVTIKPVSSQLMTKSRYRFWSGVTISHLLSMDGINVYARGEWLTVPPHQDIDSTDMKTHNPQRLPPKVQHPAPVPGTERSRAMSNECQRHDSRGNMENAPLR